MKKSLLFILGLLISVAFVNAQCTANFTYTVSAGTVSVSGTGSPTGTSTYVWQWGDGSIIPGNGQNTSHTYTASGTYSLCLTYGVLIPPATPCTSQVCQNIVVTVVGVNEYSANLKNITLSPNPSSSYVDISYSAAKNLRLSVHIIDITGKLVDEIESEKLIEAGNYSKKYSTTNLSAGIYFIRFKTEYGTETKKLIVD